MRYCLSEACWARTHRASWGAAVKLRLVNKQYAVDRELIAAGRCPGYDRARTDGTLCRGNPSQGQLDTCRAFPDTRRHVPVKQEPLEQIILPMQLCSG